MGKQAPFAFHVKLFTVGKQLTAYFSVFSLCFSPTGIISWLPILWGWHSYPFSSWLPSTSSSTPPSGYFSSEFLSISDQQEVRHHHCPFQGVRGKEPEDDASSETGSPDCFTSHHSRHCLWRLQYCQGDHHQIRMKNPYTFLSFFLEHLSVWLLLLI